MFIVGQSLGGDVFYSIYAIFESSVNLDKWLVAFDKAQFEDIKVVELENLTYPFFLFEAFGNGKNSFKYIDKEGFKEKINELENTNNPDGVYFNLWRIEKDKYNTKFPNEQCLNGRNDHLHFTDYDISQISLNGIENYWQEISH